MAYSLVKNQTPANHGETHINFCSTMLMGAGWTQPVYGNGTTYTINGTPTVNGVSGTTWLNNQNTWYVLFDPSGTKSIAVSRPTAAQPYTWRVVYSKSAGFRDIWIQFPAKVSLTDGQTLTITDGVGNTVVFEWDVSGNGVGVGNVAVNVSTDTTAAEVAARFITAASGTALAFTYVNSGSGLIYGVKTTRTGFATVATTNGSTTFAPSGTRTPVAYADQKIVWGGGTDTSPTATALFSTTSSSFRQNGAANNSSPYHFWMATATNSTGALVSSLCMDIVTNAPTGEYDDAVFYFTTTTPFQVGTTGIATEASTQALAWIGKTATAGWGTIAAQVYGLYVTTNTICIPNGCSASPIDSKDENEPIEWVRRPSLTGGNPGPFGRHGESTLFRWQSPTRSTWDLLTTTATGDRVILGAVSVPGWDNTTITV